MSEGGHTHTCAILALGRVLCWGQSGYGALGGFQTNNVNVPDPSKGVPVFFGYDERNGPSRDKTFFAKSISAGDKSTCAILEDDSLTCWGQNHHHSLGIGGSIEARGVAETMSALAPNGIDWRVPVLDRGGDAAKRPGDDIRAPLELVAGGAAASERPDQISLKTLVFTTA